MKPPFSGHGFYVYDLEGLLRAYGSSPAMGWCQGDDIPAEIVLARTAVNTCGIDHYIADIERGENGAHWTTQEIQHFFDGVRDHVAGLGMTSFGFIDGHAPELLHAAAAFVDMINPQAYWFQNFPKASMLSATGTVGKYPLANSAGYAGFCCDRYQHFAEKPVVISGQAYTTDEFDSLEAVGKLSQFFGGFDRYGDICGLNWWHLSAANKAMRDRLSAPQLKNTLSAGRR